MRQSLLILRARALYDLSEGVEHLGRDTDGFEEVGFTRWIDQLL
jgi:hypothetical protein